MTPLLFLPSVFIVPAISYWLPRDSVNLFISFAIAIFVLRPSDNNVFLHSTFVIPAMCYWLRSIGLSVFLSFALAILELRPDDNKAINKVTPNADQTKAISPSPTRDPDTGILATDKQTTDGDQTQDIQDLDSTSGKTACMDLVFWPTFFLHILPCRADIESISPTTQSTPTKPALPSQSTEPVLPSTGFDFFLPKHISSVSESINRNFGSLAHESKRPSFMPASFLPVDIPAEFASSTLPAILRSVSITRTPQFKDPKRISSPDCSDISVPAKAPSPLSLSSPPVDPTIPEFIPDMKLDSRLQVIQEKIEIQRKVLDENKTRVNKAAEELQAAKARDSKRRRRMKAKRKAEKALQVAGEKLDELHLEEESIWAAIEEAKKKIRWERFIDGGPSSSDFDS